MEIVEQKEQRKPIAKAGEKMSGAWHKTGAAFKTLFTKQRKFVILAGMFVLLCVTGYLNFALNNSPAVDTGGANTDLFTSFRNTRADGYSRDILVLQNIVDSSNYSEESKTNAQTQLLALLGNQEFEREAENLLSGEKYDDIIVSRNNGFVNVLIKKDSNIDRTQAIKIMSILQSVDPALDIDNVFISIME